MTMSRGSALIAAEGYVDIGGTKEGESPIKTTDKMNTTVNFGRGRGYYHNREETSAGNYRSVRCPWVELPPGTFINTQHNRTAEPIRAMGTKTWDTVAYGKITGSFDITFNLDYQYLHMLKFIFESADFEKSSLLGGGVKYTFKKLDNKRVRSFTIKRVILNEMAGGPLHSDEVEQLVGCVITNATFSRSANNSNIGVAITGFYTDERMYKGSIEKTEYMPYEGKLCEYMCVLVADKKKAAVEECDYVANTESVTINIGNATERIYNTCSPIASAYYEGLSSYKISTSIYSNNPEVYKQRVYGGGVLVKPENPGESYIVRPKIKGCAPLGTMKLLTYDGIASDVDEMGFVTKENMIDVFNGSGNSLCVTVEDTVLKSMTWPKGDSQKVTDNLSSQDCKYMTFQFIIHTATGKDDVLDMCENYANKNNLIHKFDESKLMGPKEW